MTGISGVRHDRDFWETSHNAVHYAAWTLAKLIDKIPNPTCARILRNVLCRVTPLGEPVICPQPITPDARATLALRESTYDSSTSPNRIAAEPGSGAADGSLSRSPDKLQWALLIPITSRGISSPEAFWDYVKPTFQKLQQSIEASHGEHTTVYIAFDHNDPIIDTPEALDQMKVVLHLFAMLSILFSGAN